MGNSSSTVTAGIKNQIDGSSNAIYPLADVTGNGVLASLAREALKLNSTEELDRAIKEKITPFLYNEGKGEMLSVTQVIQIRHKERTGGVLTTQSTLRKYICWRLDCRGAVGETLLHVCFISGLTGHMKLLAQRLIHLFPNIINDFYICDEYYGETALHMGIVNENPEIVRFLLRSGASVDVRCTGNFFTSDDQKSSRLDSAFSEHALLNRHTYYTGHLYWGEYPLAFAACLSQSDCFRMLCAYGADPNWQDTNGNTVLHICTIHENWEMFELALKCGAKLHVQNRQQLTPLTLAAYLAKKEMFHLIVKEERHIYWTYGGVMSAGYPLQHLDSIEPSTGEINRNSGLALVIYGNSADHLLLLPDLLEELIYKKWTTYARREHLKQLIMFTIYFTLMFFCMLNRPTPFERTHYNSTLICIANFEMLNLDTMHAKELLYIILNVLVVIGAVLYLLQMYFHIRNVGRTMYFLSLRGFPAKSVFLVSCCLVIFTFVLRLFCMDKFEDIIWEITILLTAVNFLFFFRGFKSVGPFVLMLYKIIIRDLIRFFIIYCVFLIGFSQSFYVLFLSYRRHDPRHNPKDGTIMSNVAESFVRMFIMSLTEFAVFFEQMEQCHLSTLGKVTFMIYMLLVTMLLMNMLIAMMTNTYTEVAANSLEYLRQWSAIVLNMEQSFDPETRLKFQRCYSVPMEDGKGIGLLMKIRLTEEEQEVERLVQKQRRRRFNEEKMRQLAED
ncbi:Nanchung [Aphelenchoides besseyi]|nr:Nanchung [Aphelenchoides besseyi]